jgi:fumarate hydratase class II
LRADVENSIGLVTALSPTLGYENATVVAQKAQVERKTVRAVVIELGLMTEADFDAAIGDVEKLVRPNG